MAMVTTNITATAQTRYALQRKTAEVSAVKSALGLLQQPRLVKATALAEIPRDVIVLLKIVAGETTDIQRISLEHNVSAENLVSAAKLYLQLLFAGGIGDDRRMLCLPPGAGRDDIREHKKWLLKWLHPDRNHDKWESAIFLKVNEAFNRLQNSDPHSAQIMAQPERRKMRSKTSRAERYYKKIDRKGLIRRTVKLVLLAGLIAVLGYVALASL